MSLWSLNFEFLETMPRSELKELQLKKLKKQVRYVYNNSPFYRRKFDEAGVKPEDIKTLDDLRKIPLTTRDEAVKDASPQNPFGGRLCVSEEDAAYIFSPQDQVLKGPLLYTAYTHDDRNMILNYLLRYFLMVGLEKGMIVELQATVNEVLSLIEGFGTTHRALQRIIPFTAIPVETSLPLIDLPRIIHLTRSIKPHIIITTVSFAKMMEDEVKKTGVSPKEAFNCKIVLHRTKLGEPFLTEDERKRFTEEWGGLHLSMMDVQDNHFFAFECPEKSGLHVWEDGFIVEVVDEKTGEAKSEDEIGKLAITNLWTKGTPMLRYLTWYNAKLVSDTCNCGRTHTRIILV